MEDLTLYQFELCPYCHKVRAGLELKGLAYRKVEVNPMTKKELPALPAGAPRKVPVLQSGGETVADSTAILAFLDEKFPGKAGFRPADEAARKRAAEIEEWVDSELIFALPTVIYGTWGEAVKAAQVTARSSNFGFLSNIGVRVGGSLIMHQVSKRLLHKRGKTDAHQWVRESIDQFEQWLGDRPFVTGPELSVADVAMHGALSCVKSFPIYQDIMRRPRVAAWFDSVQAMRDANRAS
ncbi:MAG: glutathione S-transferase family protein [Polyangiaceae bacterium]